MRGGTALPIWRYWAEIGPDHGMSAGNDWIAEAPANRCGHVRQSHMGRIPGHNTPLPGPFAIRQETPALIECGDVSAKGKGQTLENRDNGEYDIFLALKNNGLGGLEGGAVDSLNTVATQGGEDE